MKHPIDPKIDCVFKALLGRRRNRRLLLHFLNAMLAGELTVPLTTVEILNPYNAQEFLTDKLSIVDVKAYDDQGRLYQIEIQLLTHPDLPARMLYGWADLYSAQLEDGEDYGQLRPTYAIWLMGQPFRRTGRGYRHHYRMRDDRGEELAAHGGIWVYELSKFAARRVRSERERWLKFFVEGERLDADRLPSWMHTPEMKQAMKTLKVFSEKTRAYHAYQARQNYLRVQSSTDRYLRALETEVAQVRAKKEAARAAEEREWAEKEAAQAAEERERTEKERERAEKEAALAELAQLKARLRE
jgi:predicted transposase/invertase (TIGR01784 family)